ncbi:hypothetical protein PRZ48_014990 [Zasmidium cellare]|uniref:F-box domain-containing protein n=1 Tax=Zasmidium cellare TaxID=395010 RepID=A0ABR0DXD4_ZASCE|nr:hypothetical protein PRZ48_014990 [Zasmidium cellare]
MAPLEIRLYKKPAPHRPGLDSEAPRGSRRAATRAARDAVLNTAELLENVLLHLPARQIFTVKRVSRRFKAAVEKSTDIQVKLLLRLQEPEEKWRVIGRRPAAQKPIFFQKPTKSASEMANGGGAHLEFHEGMKKSINAFLKGEPQPWEDMYITDPPCTSVRLSIDGIKIGPKHSYTLSTYVGHPNGITLGALLRDSFEQKYLGMVKDNGVICRLGSRTPGEYFARRAEKRDVEVEYYNLPTIQIQRVVVPTDAERRRMRLATSRGQTDGEQRGFTFDWPTNRDGFKGGATGRKGITKAKKKRGD